MKKEKILNKLSKIKKLAEEGFYGESDNAEEILNNLLIKYDIDNDEINDDKIEFKEFRYYGFNGKQLLLQIAYKVIGTNNFKIRKYCYRGSGNCKKILIECSKSNYIEINELFNFYRYHLDKTLNDVYSAFIQTERLFGITTDTSDDLNDKDKDLSYLKYCKVLEKHDNLTKLSDGTKLIED